MCSFKHEETSRGHVTLCTELFLKSWLFDCVWVQRVVMMSLFLWRKWSSGNKWSSHVYSCLCLAHRWRSKLWDKGDSSVSVYKEDWLFEDKVSKGVRPLHWETFYQSLMRSRQLSPLIPLFTEKAPLPNIWFLPQWLGSIWILMTSQFLRKVLVKSGNIG